MNSGPMLTVDVGSLQHWRVINSTKEVHPFHIHQVHFLVYSVDGKSVNDPEWVDTVNVPYGSRGLSDGFYRSNHSRDVALPLPSFEARGQRHDGEDSLPVSGAFLFGAEAQNIVPMVIEETIALRRFS